MFCLGAISVLDCYYCIVLSLPFQSRSFHSSVEVEKYFRFSNSITLEESKEQLSVV